QAMRLFGVLGGDESYTTQHAVAQGTSWDGTITVFIDHAGNDLYEGGLRYSQGASAHNGFCVFLDLGGRNHFSYAMPQGFAGPSDYHGGTSFSLFITADDKGSSYSSKMRSSQIRLNGEYRNFANLPSLIDDSFYTKSWK